MIIRDLHEIPEDDFRIHDERRDCWCNPELTTKDNKKAYIDDTVELIVIHHGDD